MISRQRLAIIVASWLVSSIDAFRFLQTNRARHRQSQQKVTGLYHRSRPNQWDAGTGNPTVLIKSASADQTAREEGRRSFLMQVSTAAAVLLLPPLSCAKEEDSKPPIVKVVNLMNDESDLDDDVVRGEEDEKRSIKDEKQLIKELKKDIAIEKRGSSTPAEIEKAKGIIKGETESLIKEEEQLKSETEVMIKKIEAIESEVQKLEDEGTAETGGGAATEKTLEAFKDKLKVRVEQKEDLITRLKRESEKNIDPRTGKFKIMTHQEYIDRVETTDADFVQFLKDTVANEREWKLELKAFEGFLDRVFGPTIKELSKDLKPAESSHRIHYARRSKLRFEAACRESGGRTDSLIDKLGYFF